MTETVVHIARFVEAALHQLLDPCLRGGALQGSKERVPPGAISASGGRLFRSPAVSLLTLKRNVLDSISCALGALDGEPISAIRAQAQQFCSRPTATFIGGGRASVGQAAFFNAVLVRYPDLLDTYLTPGGLCHPADNFGAILAMAEHLDLWRRDPVGDVGVDPEQQLHRASSLAISCNALRPHHHHERDDLCVVIPSG